MGDPECQVILPRLKTDLVKVINDAVYDQLKTTKIEWKKDKSMTIVLCSKGYPGNYKKNININNIDRLRLSKKDYIYHAGTKLENGQLLSNGGRVLNVTSTGKNFLNIRNKILKLMKKLNWRGGFFRKDIGYKVINKK